MVVEEMVAAVVVLGGGCFMQSVCVFQQYTLTFCSVNALFTIKLPRFTLMSYCTGVEKETGVGVLINGHGWMVVVVVMAREYMGGDDGDGVGNDDSGNMGGGGGGGGDDVDGCWE